MIRQILNGGASAPIEVQVHGKDTAARRKVAGFLDERISRRAQVTVKRIESRTQLFHLHRPFIGVLETQ